MILGVDTGGTFTDFVLFDGTEFRVHKVLSTPQAPERAILQGISEMGLETAELHVIHGSTVATNAVLEGKGVRTCYITNRGLRDLLTIGRQTRRELYNLQPRPTSPPVPRELCLETGGRLGADGSIVEDLGKQDLQRLRDQIKALKPQAVAINLLFSFLDDRFEKDIEAIITDDMFVSRSSDILPEYKEYERGITTWLNAWVGPIVKQYLEQLTQQLSDSRISVMQSSGGTIAAAQAGNRAVSMLLSGPAGGLAGARFIAGQSDREQLLSFDMGGTSTDVAMINGALLLTSEGHIGHYPVAVPMVDMHTIGAGGGSIASVDSGGLLQVGPESAGADPGPACYGRGGQHATVTDANLVLGRLRADAFLGGKMTLDAAAAFDAVNDIATPLGLTVEEAATGIIRTANEHMAHALRVISVQRGHDPQHFTLVSFGGAGGLHVCALADALGMTQALVPIHAGVLSALGMLVAPRTRELSRTFSGLLDNFNDQQIVTALQSLEIQGRGELIEEGVADHDITIKTSLDLRYRGQSYTLNIPWLTTEDCAAEFHNAHEARYGHRLDLEIELVNIRIGLRGPDPLHGIPVTSHASDDAKQADETVKLYSIDDGVSVLKRAALPTEEIITGPALITETVSTTYIAPTWQCHKDAAGNLILYKKS